MTPYNRDRVKRLVASFGSAAGAADDGPRPASDVKCVRCVQYERTLFRVMVKGKAFIQVTPSRYGDDHGSAADAISFFYMLCKAGASKWACEEIKSSQAFNDAVMNAD